ncbi:hypothetical protein AB0478_17840 [Streptomyces sp. NPDC051917]|uniref:hypothetical protein n=1 Tax=Streptomyces sp. NPDC051917 TaxID=3154754 RepID=UPI00344E2E17
MKWRRRSEHGHAGVSKSPEPPAPFAKPALASLTPVLHRTAGHGTQVVRLPAQSEPVVLTLTHQAPGHFVVDALDGRLHSVSQLVYTDGPFAGRLLVGGPDAQARALRVQADGPWTAETAPLAAAPALTAEEHRPASDVLHYTGGPATAVLSYEGDAGSDDGGHFLVDTFSPDGTRFLDELANHVGPWQGEVPLPGPCVLYARSDGPWSISVRPL